jgi:hypothetical protein
MRGRLLGKLGRRAAATSTAAAVTAPAARMSGSFNVGAFRQATRGSGPVRPPRGSPMFGPTRADMPSATSGRFTRTLGRPHTMRRRMSTAGLKVGGGVMGAGLGMNAVLGPRPPSSGRNGLQPGGSGLPY